MGDWRNLPIEILELCSKRLHSPLDRLRFRSVCSSWRSSCTSLYRSPSLPHPGPLRLHSECHLYVRTLCLVELPSNHSCNTHNCSTIWLGEIFNGDAPTHFLHSPRPRCQETEESVRMRPSDMNPDCALAKSLNFVETRVSEIGQDCVLACPEMYKVAVLWLEGDSTYVLLSYDCNSVLMLYASSDKKWTEVEDPYDYQSRITDTVAYDGKFYTVDDAGWTMGLSLNDRTLEIVAAPFTGGFCKSLVESCGDLLLIDVLANDEGGGHHIKFRVYKLEVTMKKWIPVGSIGNRMLLIGSHSSLSVTGSDFFGRRDFMGNSVIYSHDLNDDNIASVVCYKLDTGESCFLDSSFLFNEFFRYPSYV